MKLVIPSSLTQSCLCCGIVMTCLVFLMQTSLATKVMKQKQSPNMSEQSANMSEQSANMSEQSPHGVKFQNMSEQSAGHGQGNCVDASGNYFDSWFTDNLNYTQCTAYCAAEPGCLGVTHKEDDGTCELRYLEGTLPNDSPSRNDDCDHHASYDYEIAFAKEWCTGVNVLTSTMGASVMECEDKCHDDALCHYYLYVTDGGNPPGFTTCLTYPSCHTHHEFGSGYAEIVKKKLPKHGSKTACPMWGKWNKSDGNGHMHHVEGKNCYYRDRGFSYEVFKQNQMCRLEYSLELQVNTKQCDVICSGDPTCKYYSNGTDWGCFTFEHCPGPYMNLTGGMTYEKKISSTSHFIDITPPGTDAGCVDNEGRAFDALWKEQQSLSECQTACQALENCLGIAFVTATGYCELEFNNDHLPDSNDSIPEGFEAWDGGKGDGGIDKSKHGQGDGHICYKAIRPVTASGDPHLTNMQGKKFDIHDGKHRLVHYPRGVPDSEALLMIDVDAEILDGKTSCYNVFLQSANISGKWVGDNIFLKHDASPMGQRQFYVYVRDERLAWPKLDKDAASIKFSGTMPTTVRALVRAEDKAEFTPGGDEIDFVIGQKHPVVVEVWASHGSSELTDGQDVQYLNLQVKNLPRKSGGLLGLDEYVAPTAAKCGLTNAQSGPLNSMSDLISFYEPEQTLMFNWHVSASYVE